MKGQIAIGTYTGTGAAINLSLGFIPDYFMCINITDGDVKGEWFNGMTAGTAIDTAAAVAANAADGFTSYAGASASAGAGITIGTDYSESAKVYRYVAMAAQ